MLKITTFLNLQKGEIMKYFKIYSLEKKAYWTQDQYGYTDEKSAGWWAENKIPHAASRDPESQKLIEYQPTILIDDLTEYFTALMKYAREKIDDTDDQTEIIKYNHLNNFSEMMLRNINLDLKKEIKKLKF